jgi:CHAD domain-containing protein
MVRALQRRLAFAVDLGRGRHDAALRSIAHAAARSGARSLDAVVLDGVIRVALSDPEPAALPERSARLDQLVGAMGLRVRFVRGPEVTQPALDPSRRARRGLVRAAGFHLARIASRWRGALDDHDPEEVHALRASLRRLKATLWVIGDGALDARLRALRVWARALAPLTGGLRDLDVALASLRDLAPDAASLAHARTRLLAARRRARDAMFAHLRQADVVATLRAAMSAAPRLREPRGRARRVARPTVARGLGRLARALDGDLQHPEGYHLIRRRARRVRDVVEVTEGALRKRDRAWRERLKAVQSQLGDLHDIDVLTGLLPDDDRALDGLRGAVERRRATLVAGLGAPLALLAVELREARR